MLPELRKKLLMKHVLYAKNWKKRNDVLNREKNRFLTVQKIWMKDLTKLNTMNVPWNRQKEMSGKSGINSLHSWRQLPK
jgi:hypothetical protein